MGKGQFSSILFLNPQRRKRLALLLCTFCCPHTLYFYTEPFERLIMHATEYASAFLICFLVTGLDPLQPVSAWTTGYATITAVYLNCFIFILCVVSNGHTVLHNPTCVKTLVFQIIHGHLGCVCVLKMFALDPKSAILLSNIVIMQSHFSLTDGIRVFRNKLPVNPEWIFRISTFFVFLCIHHLLGVDPFQHLELNSYTKLLSTQYPVAMFVAPAAVHGTSTFITSAVTSLLKDE
jgi:hypothetical protein